jgi:hypothetical protein
MYKHRPGSRSRFQAIYTNVPYQCDLPLSHDQFFPVDAAVHSHSISIVGDWPRPSPPSQDKTPNTLQSELNKLHPSLLQTLGKITFPPDNGVALIRKIDENSNKLFCSSDASLKQAKATHAWIVSSGDITDIEDPKFNISGSGPVHGLPSSLSSARAELQGITA